MKTFLKKCLAAAFALMLIGIAGGVNHANAAGEIITYNIDKTDNHLVNVYEDLNIEINFPNLTSNTQVVLKIPKRLNIITPSFSTRGGVPVINNYSVDSSSDPYNRLYIYDIKDGITGDYNIATRVNFNEHLAYQGQSEEIVTSIINNGTTSISEQLVLTNYVNNRITLTSNYSPNQVFSNDVPLNYRVRIYREGQSPDGNWKYSKSSTLKNVIIKIKIPENSIFIKSGGFTYDANNHLIYIKTSDYNEWYRDFNIQLQFTGLPEGSKLEWPNNHVWPNGSTGAMQITGKEGGVIDRAYTYDLNWNGATIELPKFLARETSRNTKHSLIIGQDNQSLVCNQLLNTGTLDGQNTKVTYTFPLGMKAHGIFLASSKYTPDDMTYSLEFTTNLGNTNTVPLSTHNKYYNRSDLGLGSNEYMISATLVIDEFYIGKQLYQNQWYYNNGTCIFGDIDENIDTSLPIEITMSNDAKDIGTPRQYLQKYSNKEIIGLHTSNTTNKYIINPGEIFTIKNNTNTIWYAYNQQNSSRIHKFNMYMLIPDGFTPIASSLNITNVDSFTPMEFVKNEDGFNIYKVEIEREFEVYSWYKTNSYGSMVTTLDIQSDITTDAGDYDFYKAFVLTTDNPLKTFSGSRGSSLITDEWGLNPTHNTLLRANGVGNVTVNKSTFGIQDYVLGGLGSVAQSYDAEDPKSADFTGENTNDSSDTRHKGSVKATIYNPATTTVDNFEYVVALPFDGDTYNPVTSGEGSEWSAQLSSAVDVSSITGATVEYSADGVNFSDTFDSSAKFVKVLIPTIAAQAQYDIEIPVEAPDMGSDVDYQLEAWMPTGYSAAGVDYDLGTKKLRLIDAIPATGNVTFSTTDPTNGNVTMTLTTTENIVTPTGWTKVSDTQYTKVIDQNETSELTITDNSGNTSKVEYSVNNIDKVAPTIAVAGDAPMIVEAGSGFTDPGATCSDANSCILTTTGVSDVNPNVPGEYTITYSAVDPAGNTKTTTRIVKVQDTIAPNLTVSGDATTDIEVGSSFTQPVYACSDNIGCTTTVTGSVDPDTVGSYTLTYTSVDTSGNTTVVHRVFNVIDTTAPTLTINGNTTPVLEAGVVNYVEQGYTCEDTVSCDVVVSGDTVDTDTPGTYTVIYTATDPDGNVTVKNRVVTVTDTTDPTIELVGDESVDVELGTPYVEQGATCEDNVSCEVVVSGDTVDTDTPGTYTVIYTATDTSGNSVVTTREVIVKDTIKPTITLTGESEITLKSGDEYIEQGATCEDNISCEVIITGEVDMQTPGTYTLTYTAIDEAGNTDVVTRTVVIESTGGTTFSPSQHNGGNYEGSDILPEDDNESSNETDDASESDASNDEAKETNDLEDKDEDHSEEEESEDADKSEIENDIQDIIDEMSFNSADDEDTVIDTFEEKKVSKAEIMKRMKKYDSCSVIDKINNPKDINSAFSDAYLSKYRDSIVNLEYADVVDGRTNSFFAIDDSVTRTEFIKMVLRAHCQDYSNQNTKFLYFDDVDKNSWNAKVIAKAIEIGIVEKNTSGNFYPNKPITRLEATKILMNTSFHTFDDGLVSKYLNISKDSWENKYIAQAEQIGLYNSQENSEIFQENQVISRDVLSQYLEIIVNLYDPSKPLVTKKK